MASGMQSHASILIELASPIKIHQSLLCAGNQYWMPDHLCKVCYDCSVAFSIFRRRHHCRLCGQIFCHECSDFFVNGTAHGFPGMVRVCKFCFQFTNTASDKENVVQESHQGRHSFECFDGDDAARESFSSRFDELSRRQSESFGSAKPSPLVFGPPVDLNEVPTSSLSPVRSTSCDSLSFDHFLGSTHLSSESVNNLNVPNTVEDHYSFYSRIQTGRRRSSAELLGAIESGGLSAEKQKSSKDNAITAREESNWEVDVQERKNLDTQRDIALDKYMVRKERN
ncbi:hypothetical protein PsorP6_002646 [Peronosclerospora sorghi]|uniref:Uncharacterized protein n=1 Tax=Peronosclerospora sorghi TaxID=230839 RepID=A0ACC0WU23_9STRA|nr:hypothetical protein PsorP6_002646 [Peronosclerospora sorghi]